MPTLDDIRSDILKSLYEIELFVQFVEKRLPSNQLITSNISNIREELLKIRQCLFMNHRVYNYRLDIIIDTFKFHLKDMEQPKTRPSRSTDITMLIYQYNSIITKAIQFNCLSYSDEEYAFRNYTWDETYAELNKFVTVNGRLPDYYSPKDNIERSLGAWVLFNHYADLRHYLPSMQSTKMAAYLPMALSISLSMIHLLYDIKWATKYNKLVEYIKENNSFPPPPTPATNMEHAWVFAQYMSIKTNSHNFIPLEWEQTQKLMSIPIQYPYHDAHHSYNSSLRTVQEQYMNEVGRLYVLIYNMRDDHNLAKHYPDVYGVAMSIYDILIKNMPDVMPCVPGQIEPYLDALHENYKKMNKLLDQYLLKEKPACNYASYIVEKINGFCTHFTTITLREIIKQPDRLQKYVDMVDEKNNNIKQVILKMRYDQAQTFDDFLKSCEAFKLRLDKKDVEYIIELALERKHMDAKTVEYMRQIMSLM